SLYTTARTGFYTLALHDALPILRPITSDGSSDSDLLAWPVKYLIREYYGGQGNDTYVLNRYQSAVEYGDEGIDTVRSLVGQKLDPNIENLVLVGNEAIDGTGNSLANAITGNAADNVLAGGAGDDTPIGRRRPDTAP